MRSSRAVDRRRAVNRGIAPIAGVEATGVEPVRQSNAPGQSQQPKRQSRNPNNPRARSRCLDGKPSSRGFLGRFHNVPLRGQRDRQATMFRAVTMAAEMREAPKVTGIPDTESPVGAAAEGKAEVQGPGEAAQTGRR